MKSIIAFALLVAAVSAVPVGPLTPDGDAQILDQQLDNIGLGDYKASFQTSNGISASEQGKLKNVGTENEANEVTGQFSYIGTDGVTYSVTYIANENGFQPSGAHIPQA